MAKSCVVVTPALRVKAKEYNVSVSTMSLATQSWLDKGNRLNMSEELFNKYLDSYFKKNTSIPYKNEEIYEKAIILWKKYNGKVFDKFSEGKKAYTKAIQYFNGENTILCELPEGKYELRISKPVFSTANKTDSELQEIKEKALRNGTFMKAPNGKPTNLTEKQWLQVRTKAFKDWFGDWTKITFDKDGKVLHIPDGVSKVVDENGEPLVVYHGTPNGGFNIFEKRPTKRYTGDGFYFTADKEYAEAYHREGRSREKGENPQTYEVFLNIKNPIQNGTPLGGDDFFIYETDVVNVSNKLMTFDGHDGIFDRKRLLEMVVPNPNQIKSATDNIGSFSKENDDIYYQKSMLDELKKLKAINRPLEALGSDRNIEKYLSRTIDSTLVKPIIKAIELDPNLKKLTPYDLFQTISKKREEDIANEYNEHIQKKIDKKLEEHLVSYLKKYNIEYDDLGEFVKEYGVDGLYDVLGKTIHVAKEGERNYLTVPEEFSHAFVELMGSVYKKNRDKFPENKDFSELFDGVEKTSIYQQVFEQYKDIYTNEDGSPNIFKIKKEAIGQALAVSIANKWENKDISETPFWDKLKEWFQKLMAKFKGFEYINFETLIDTIAEEVINNDHSRLEKINSENYNLLDYSETIANQNKKDGGKAVNFMQYFTSLGNIITGSLSYRKQGTVYRSKLDSLHDIDMIVPYEAHGIDITQMQYREASKSYAEDGALLKLFMQEPYFKQIKEKYPKIKFCAAYRSKGDYMTLNAIYCEDESISEKFAGLKGSYASRLDQFTEEERDKIYLFDFFIKKEGQNTDYIKDPDNNLKLARFDVSFKEKQFSMGRAKDIYDYQSWKLYNDYRKSYIPKKENMMFQLPSNVKLSTPESPLQIYSDGSDIKGTGAIGYGAVFKYNGKKYGLSGTDSGEEVQKLKKLYPDAKFSNPTMEMLALATTLEHFANLGIGEHIEINQDYKGAVNYNGLWNYSEGSNQRDAKAWKAKEPYIKYLVDRAEAAIKKIENNGGSVKIRWVKGHAGEEMNEAADSYAKSRDNSNNFNDAYTNNIKITSSKLESQSAQQQVPNGPGSETKINIYAGTNENADLSNFAIRPFKLTWEELGLGPGYDEVEEFQSVEQAFQWLKVNHPLYNDSSAIEDVSVNTTVSQEIKSTTNGARLRQLGKAIRGLDSKSWDVHSSEEMKKLIKASFEQNPQALQRLLATGNATLTHTQDKGKWGTEFPRILMEVREELRNNTQNTELEDTTTTTSKLDEAREKINKLKAESEARVTKSTNFKEDHTYYRKVNGKLVPVKYSVTEIKSKVNPNYHESAIDDRWKLPASTLGNINDDIMRAVFSMRDPNNKKSKLDIKSEARAKALASQNINDAQFNALWKKVIDEEKGIFKQISSIVGDKWECTSDEIILLGKVNNEYVAGTPDLIVWNDKGEFFIFDFKTLRSTVGYENKKLGWSTQVYTYGNMMHSMAGINIKDARAIVTSTWYPDAIKEVIYYEEDGILKMKDIKTQNEKTSLQNYDAFKKHFVNSNPNGVFKDVFIENLSVVDTKAVSSAIEATAKVNEHTPAEQSPCEEDFGKEPKVPNSVVPTPTEVKKIKELKSLDDLPVREKKMLADSIMYSVSDAIDILQTNLEEDDLIADLVMSHPKLKGSFEERKKTLSQMSRLEIINTIGLNNLFRFVRESEFSDDYMEVEEDKVESMKIAYNNFDALCSLGYSKLLTLEKISPVSSNEKELNFYEGDEELKDSNDMGVKEEDERESWQTNFRNQSMIGSLATEVRGMFEKLPTGRHDKYGYKRNEYEDPNRAIVITQKLLSRCNTIKEMEKVLEKNAKYYQWMYNILDAIKEDDKTGYNSLRHKFFRNFRKDFTVYSTVVPRFNRNTHKYEYDVYTINTKGAEQSILDTAKVNFEFNINQKLFKKEGDVYKPDTKGLAEVYAGANEIYKNLKNQADVEKFIPKLYKVLTEMGISDKVLSETTFRTIIQKQNNPVSFITGQTGLLKNIQIITGPKGTAMNVNSKDNPLDTKFNSAYSRLVYMLAEYMDDYTESSTYENGKMYYSYCNPSYMGKMMRNLTNMNDTDFNKYIFEHYGQFKFFKNDEKSQFRTEMLERLAPINADANQDFINKRTNGKFTDARDILQHKVELTFDKEGYKDYDEFKETMSFILNFFHSETGTAWYRIPIYANKPSNEFYRFIRYEDNAAEGFSYKDHISEGLFNTFQQELMRMKMVLEMATDDEKLREKYSIKNRNIPEKTLKNLKWNGKDLTIGYVPGTKELDINIYHLRALIEENKKKPNGCNFKFLDGLNDILMKDYKEGTRERKLQEYIVKKLRATTNDMVGNKSIDNTSIIPVFKEYINEWVSDQYKEARKEWERIGILEEDKQHNYKYLSEEKISGVKKPTKKDIDDALENYFWNDMYATINIIQLTVTDVSYYKNIEDFQKRYAQLHAPALRFDEYAVDYGRLKNASGKEEVMFVAKQEVNRSRGQIEPRAYHRTIYIEDDIVESDIIPNVTKVFDIVIAKERAAGHTIQAAMLESKKDDIIKSFKEINVADAQGYTSPTAYRKLKYMSGEWTEEMEDAYLELMKGNFDISNMNLLMQPLKPFVYTQISKNTNATTLSTMPVPIQNKNSEYALMLSYAIMKGAGKEGSRIAAIYDFMEESAYDGRELKNGVVQNKKEGTYNGRGIDTIQFKSAVKSGLQGVLDINDSAIENYRKQQGWENLTDYEIVKRVLKEHTYEGDGQYNQAYVHEIPFEDYGEQQAVPDHFQDHEQPMGSQIRILDVADAENPDEHRYKVNGSDELLSMRELREEYFQLQSDNIEESIKELQKEFLLSDEVRKESVAESLYSFAKRNNDYPLKSLLKTLESKRLIPANSLNKILKYESKIKELNSFISTKKLLDNISKKEGINFAISKAERNYILSDLLVREVQKDQRYGADLLEAVSINPETGDFNIPLSDEVQSQRIQRLLNSIIKKNINKQKIKGGPVVQASVYGASSDLKVVFADKEGKPMDDFNTYAENYKKENEGKTFTEDDIKEDYKKYLTDNQAGLSHFEIYITCPSKELEDLLVSKSTKDKDYMTNPQEAVKDGIIPKEILDMIGYRIPTEDKYSMQPCKVKGFLPRSAGEVVMLPKEITLLSGSDFDIDKLYVMTKSFIYKNGKFDLNTFGNEGRNNRIFDLQWSVLTNSDTMSKMFNPGSFDMHKESAKRIEILEAQNTRKLNTTYTYEDLEKMGIKQLDDILSAKKQKNIIFSTTQVYFHKQNMTSGKLIGIFANNNTSHAFVNIHNDNEIYKGTNNPIVLNIRNENCRFTISKNDKDKNPLKIGSEVIEIDKLKSHDGVTLISKVLASYLAASVDAVKDPVLNKMNINNITAGPAMVLTRLGCNPDTVGIILKQPIIEKILDNYNKANNIGYKSIDKVVRDILDENIKDTETYADVHFGLNFDLSELSKKIGKKVVSTKKLDRTQLKVAQLFYNLLQMSNDLNELTLCTKFNSLSNTVGPLISDTMVTNMRVSKFQEKCATDEDNAIFSNAQGVFIPAIIEKNPMLNSFYKTFTDVSKQMFKDNFPHYSNAFGIILNELIAISGDKGITADIIDDAIDYWAVFRATRNNVFSFDENKRKYFLSKNFINKVQKIKDKEELKENQFIQTLQENIYKGNPYVDIKGGGLTSEQQEDIKTSWASLLESDDEEVQKFAFEIAEYFVFRGGFGFNPKTVMHLMPNKVKMNIEGYNEVMSTWSTSYDEDRFVELFIRNIYGNKKLSNKFITQLPKDIKQSNDVSFEERNGKNIYSISSELMEATGLLDKTKTYPMFIEVPYGNKKYIGVSRNSSGDRVEFELLEPLGSTYNYIEMDYNTTSPIQSIEDDTTDPDDPDSADNGEDNTPTPRVDVNKVDSSKATEYAGTKNPGKNPVDEKKAQDTAIKNGICYNK